MKIQFRALASRHPDLMATAAVGLPLITVVLLGDDSVWWKCPIHQITGRLCPGCGFQRALAALAHGDAIQAFLLNPTIFIGPLLVVAAILAQRAESKKWEIILTVIAATYVVGMTIVRNL